VEYLEEEMEYKDLNAFTKYCLNRFNYEKFLAAMLVIYPGQKSYVENLWSSFRDNPIVFIISRGERELFDVISEEIKTIGYRG
jgi:hypothetical protein